MHWRIKRNFFNGVRVVREGTTLAELSPRFHEFGEVEEEPPDLSIPDFPEEEESGPPKKILVHKPSTKLRKKE